MVDTEETQQRMLSKTLTYISHHAIAILALVCSLLALAGASYAATQLPKNSVGNAQIQRGAVAPPKFSKQIGGYVRLYAKLTPAGKIIYASPGAKVTQWAPSSTGIIGFISWPHQTVSSKACSALATAGNPPQGPISATVFASRTRTSVEILSANPGSLVTVAVVC
jgi:hypothetical protein